MEVVSGIVTGKQLAGSFWVPHCLVEVDNPVEGATGSDPLIEALALLLAPSGAVT